MKVIPDQLAEAHHLAREWDAAHTREPALVRGNGCSSRLWPQ